MVRIGLAIKDHELSAQVAAIGRGKLSVGEAHTRLRVEIEQRYTPLKRGPENSLGR